MRLGVAVSSVGHATILAFALVSLPSPQEFDTSSFESLPIEVFSVEEFSNLRQGDKTAEETPEPTPAPVAEPETPPDNQAAQQEQVAALAPETPAPEPVPEPEPLAEPAPLSEPVIAEPEPEPTPEPEVAQPDEPTPQAEPVVPASLPIARPKNIPPAPRRTETTQNAEEFDANDIQALLNKEKLENQQRSNGTGSGGQVASLGANAGTGNGLSQSEMDFLRGQIAKCWSPPIGAADPNDLIVRVQMRLSPDGNLEGTEILEFRANPSGKAAADSALRAVRRCAPYTLPLEKFAEWNVVNVRFDPRDMLN